jgi:hypothetical protein
VQGKQENKFVGIETIVSFNLQPPTYIAFLVVCISVFIEKRNSLNATMHRELVQLVNLLSWPVLFLLNCLHALLHNGTFHDNFLMLFGEFIPPGEY